MSKTFALIGVAGYIAPRHLEAIKNINGVLRIAYDYSDAVGVLDNYFPDCNFYTSEQAFEQALTKEHIDYLVICSPNHYHEQHCMLGLKAGIAIICEKPLTTSLDSLYRIQAIATQQQINVNSILQLRLHPEVIAIKQTIVAKKQYTGTLTYFTPRGKWYLNSWKGKEEQSGGIATNIGVHFFDMLCWFFGTPKELHLIQKDSQNAKGSLVFEFATIDWHLSVERSYMPQRSLILNNLTYNFSNGFQQLHTECYQQIINNNGFSINDVLPSIAITDAIKNAHTLGRIAF